MIRITRKHFADKIDFLGYFTEINVLHRVHAGFNYLSLSFFLVKKYSMKTLWTLNVIMSVLFV